MERRHVEYTCRQETESTSFPIFDREELESCNTKFPRNTELRCSRSSREVSSLCDCQISRQRRDEMATSDFSVVITKMKARHVTAG